VGVPQVFVKILVLGGLKVRVDTVPAETTAPFGTSSISTVNTKLPVPL
jgi:hypothetical protein